MFFGKGWGRGGRKLGSEEEEVVWYCLRLLLLLLEHREKKIGGVNVLLGLILDYEKRKRLLLV